MGVFWSLKDQVMDNCSLCGSRNKISLEDYTIRTRVPGREKILIKNVRFLQCTVCDNKEATENSKSMLNLIRRHYTNKYFNETSKSQKEAGNGFKNILKRIGIF